MPTALLNTFLHPRVSDRNQDIVPVELNQETLLLSPLAVFRSQLLQATVQGLPCSSGLGLEEPGLGTEELLRVSLPLQLSEIKRKKERKDAGVQR